MYFKKIKSYCLSDNVISNDELLIQLANALTCDAKRSELLAQQIRSRYRWETGKPHTPKAVDQTGRKEVMHTGKEFANQAKSTKYDKLKYTQYDCQAFVELVLYDTGVKKPDGKAYNWKGSNSMWRNALSWKGTKEECIATFGCIPLGAWVFMVSHDGGEVDRGYHDNEGNASHVGIYIGGGVVRDSTRSTKTKRDGVGSRSISDFNYVGLCKYLDYNVGNVNNKSQIKSILDEIDNLLRKLREVIL